MDIHTATEEAYKKGYEQGKKDAVVHGRWRSIRKEEYDENGRLITSEYRGAIHDECGCKIYYKTNYCPNCGADMRGGEDG